MKLAITMNLDRVRSIFEGFTRSKSAEGAAGGLRHNDVVPHQAEMQFALQELRNLVLETTPLEMTLRTDPAGDSEIEPFSSGPVDVAPIDTTDDLLAPTVENHCSSDSVPTPLTSLTGPSLAISCQQA